MCGIAGTIGLKHGQQKLESMLLSMHHRGPDDSGIRVVLPSTDAWLGSVRLAILDLSSAGHMPMEDAETGHVIVFNGEVFNYKELRKELETQGLQFVSETDTEVVLKAYRAWGRDCIQRFRGMFSFAIWNPIQQTFFLARDRLGIKPLYYWHNSSGEFMFASEVRALAGILPSRRLNPEGLDCYLFNGFLVDPLTLVQGIASLMPGHWMEVDSRGKIIAQQKYWSLPSAKLASPPPSQEELLETLTDAVRLRMISDVPLGAFLSGGLDSSAIVALMAKLKGDIRTFSIAFREKQYDESRYARHTAERFHTAHQETILSPTQFASWLPDIVKAFDQPSFDGVNTYCVSRAAKENGLTVALSGLGADEVFGGYPFFKSIPRIFALRHQMPFTKTIGKYFRALTPNLRGVSGPLKLCELSELPSDSSPSAELLAIYQTAQMMFPRQLRTLLLQSSSNHLFFGLPSTFSTLCADESDSHPLLHSITNYALRLFLGQRCLKDTDSVSMAVSLEVRAPFTDHIWLQKILQVADTLRCREAPQKFFEQRLVEPLLGKDSTNPRKQGFSFPFKNWLSTPPLSDTIKETLCDRSLCESTGLNAGVPEKILTRYLQNPSAMPWSRIWSLYMLLDWCRHNKIQL